MRPRIAYIVTEDWYFLSHRLPMARAARDAGFEVHVLTRIDRGRAAIESEGFVAHPLSWRRSSLSPVDNLSAIAEIARLLRRLRPDIVHNVAMKPALLGSAAALALPSAAVVNSITGVGSAFLARSWKGRALQAVMRRFLVALLNRRNSATIVQNPDDSALLAKAGVMPARFVLIPGSGVDTVAFAPAPEPSGPVRIAFVGRMLEDKGVRTLVEAFRILRASGSTAELHLAGDPDPENPTSIPRSEIEAWARDPGIQWTGHVSDIAGLWRQSHIAVLPSRREGLPKSLLEAAAAGRPMIAADVPGCREVVLDGETGLLAGVDDPASFAEVMGRLAADAALRARFGAAARALAVSRFSDKAVGQATVALYHRLAPSTSTG